MCYLLELVQKQFAGILVAEVTTPVPSRSNDPSNHKREKLPAVLVCLGYWLGGLG